MGNLVVSARGRAGRAMGLHREAYDRIWPVEIRAQLACRVLDAPFSLRQKLLAAVRDELTQRGETVTMSALAGALEDARARLEGH